MDPDTMNYVLSRIPLDEKKFLAMPSNSELVSARYVSKKIKPSLIGPVGRITTIAVTM